MPIVIDSKENRINWSSLKEWIVRLSPAITYVAIGFILSYALGPSKAGVNFGYFKPLEFLVQNLLFIDHSNLRIIVSFFNYICLGALFIFVIKSGYISLGFEGAFIIGVTAFVCVAHFTASQVSLFGSLAGFIASLTIIFLLFYILKLNFFRGRLDDVTPGIILNILALNLAAVALSYFNLLDNEAQNVQSEAIAGAIASRSNDDQLNLGFGLVVIAILLCGFFSVVSRNSLLGVRLRAVGANQTAAWIAGVPKFWTAMLLAIVSATLISIVSAAQYLAFGRVSVGYLEGLVVAVLSTAMLSRLSYFGLPFGALTVLGLSEFGTILEISGYSRDMGMAIQGGVIIFASFFIKLKSVSRNE